MHHKKSQPHFPWTASPFYPLLSRANPWRLKYWILWVYSFFRKMCIFVVVGVCVCRGVSFYIKFSHWKRHKEFPQIYYKKIAEWHIYDRKCRLCIEFFTRFLSGIEKFLRRIFRKNSSSRKNSNWTYKTGKQLKL